ncbi:hypothetical protein [Moorena sp. SIO3B2]|uniref:hypothetical protein n=1 Tax=Moorena sp. SIO3B2 TaxID=2607827 RepID=UPI0013C77F06|nr:hypothetical protein [Moorena sp. SIO3B2]NEP35386.1 hypothetical protein [Moorena sp. SIO3B2]
MDILLSSYSKYMKDHEEVTIDIVKKHMEHNADQYMRHWASYNYGDIWITKPNNTKVTEIDFEKWRVTTEIIWT